MILTHGVSQNTLYHDVLKYDDFRRLLEDALTRQRNKFAMSLSNIVRRLGITKTRARKLMHYLEAKGLGIYVRGSRNREYSIQFCGGGLLAIADRATEPGYQSNAA